MDLTASERYVAAQLADHATDIAGALSRDLLERIDRLPFDSQEKVFIYDGVIVALASVSLSTYAGRGQRWRRAVTLFRRALRLAHHLRAAVP